jgi:hypothetical protein
MFEIEMVFIPASIKLMKDYASGLPAYNIYRGKSVRLTILANNWNTGSAPLPNNRRIL